ncbi:2,3-dihydro-2,3-dihydroxybenzoate dehydrogenase [Gynuella sp.]|uniref:2,3-dihydro-2,3-dihydroxybenzoate dehydrogenase n=1 Tax=Gynuella sp. TaxID=2969146 RepID=UPI003D0FCA90
MMTELDFSGHSVWVTGAGRGIGLATAQRFAALGAVVTGLDRNFDRANKYPFDCYSVDLSDADQVAAECNAILSQQPHIHSLINAAGILHTGATEDISRQAWQDCFNVNVGAAFNLFQQLIPQFKQQRSGNIVTVSSNAAHVPRMQMSAYCASKAALTSLNHCVALELANHNVRCNVVSPGSTDTDMQRSLWHTADARQQTINGFPDQYKLGIPLGKIATANEIANTIVFLASDMASHITLQDIIVDGGATFYR